jgi:hypothetical protein
MLKNKKNGCDEDAYEWDNDKSGFGLQDENGTIINIDVNNIFKKKPEKTINFKKTICHQMKSNN